MLKIPAIHYCSANYYSQKMIIIYEDDILSLDELQKTVTKKDYRVTVTGFEEMILINEELEN